MENNQKESNQRLQGKDKTSIEDKKKTRPLVTTPVKTHNGNVAVHSDSDDGVGGKKSKPSVYEGGTGIKRRAVIVEEKISSQSEGACSLLSTSTESSKGKQKIANKPLSFPSTSKLYSSDHELGTSAAADSDSEEEAVFCISDDPKRFKMLQNSERTGNKVLVPLRYTTNVASFMEPDFDSENVIPGSKGVFRTPVHFLDNANAVGYIRIQGNTVKPPEVYGNGKILYWVLKGNVTVRSTGGYYQPTPNSINSYLFGKQLEVGACIVIPKDTVYIMENYGAEEVTLGYTIIPD